MWTVHCKDFQIWYCLFISVESSQQIVKLLAGQLDPVVIWFHALLKCVFEGGCLVNPCNLFIFKYQAILPFMFSC